MTVKHWKCSGNIAATLYCISEIASPRQGNRKGDDFAFQCCGSMTFWCGSGSMPLSNWSGFGFGSWSGSWIRILLLSSLTFKMPTVFCLYFLKVHLETRQKAKESHKTSGIKVFRTYYDRRIRSQPLTNGSWSGSRRPKNIGTDLTDQDPQHCRLWFLF